MVVMRHPNPGAAEFLSKNVDACIVNAGDGTHEHPTQALLDAYSIREKFGEVAGKRIVIVGDILHSRVALSNIFALNMLGAEVKICGPKSLLPKHIESLGVTVESRSKKSLAMVRCCQYVTRTKRTYGQELFPLHSGIHPALRINTSALAKLAKRDHNFTPRAYE